MSRTRKPSRRDFLAATAATGLALGIGPGAAASQEPAGRERDTAPPGEPAMYRGTAAGAVLAQLRAAVVRTLFHTNTSAFVPFFVAISAAGDGQVINMTHEGQPVAPAAGYPMPTR